MVKQPGLDVFQELRLVHPEGAKVLKATILKYLSKDWHHRPDLEKDTVFSDDIGAITIERNASDIRPGVTLWMAPQKDGSYKVTNIVPTKDGNLGRHGYNAALINFLKVVVAPAKKNTSLDFFISNEKESIEDWAGKESAEKLKVFSRAANKSTGRGHPMDEKRWLQFLLSAHQENVALEGDQLARWLIEAERWPEEIAYDLASEYSFGRTLLKIHDKSR